MEKRNAHVVLFVRQEPIDDGDVGIVHTQAIPPHVEELAALLESDDDYTLVNTTAALKRVAETAPESIEPLAERFVALLDHEHDLVRLNACWTLGRSGLRRPR